MYNQKTGENTEKSVYLSKMSRIKIVQKSGEKAQKKVYNIYNIRI